MVRLFEMKYMTDIQIQENNLLSSTAGGFHGHKTNKTESRK